TVTFSLYARTMGDLMDGLINHELDIALTNRAIANDVHGVLWQNQLVARQSVAIVGPYGEQPKQSFPQGYEDKKWILPGRNMGIRSMFESFCATQQYRADIKAEVDDMAMMRLLARDSGFLSVMPPVVVKDEIEAKKLQVYQALPQAYEHFYAILLPRKFIPEVLLHLLRSQQLE
ncbi:MAG: substrate-binding domain-containing protein, partial [Marinomonas gallaica]